MISSIWRIGFLCPLRGEFWQKFANFSILLQVIWFYLHKKIKHFWWPQVSRVQKLNIGAWYVASAAPHFNVQQKSNCGPISSDTRLTRVLRYHINDQLLNRRPMSAQHGPDQELAQNPTHFGFSPSSIFQPTATTGYRSGRAPSRGALQPRRRSAASRNIPSFFSL